MPRLDVYPIPGGGPGYVVDVQADLLTHLRTRAVVPLLPQDQTAKPIQELNPVFEIKGQMFVMLTQAIATVPLGELRQAIASLAPHRDEITRALDVLFLGF